MSYRKEIESKLVRVMHVIDFKDDVTRAIDLKQILAHVPDEARVKYVQMAYGANTEIWFEEETEG